MTVWNINLAPGMGGRYKGAAFYKALSETAGSPEIDSFGIKVPA